MAMAVQGQGQGHLGQLLRGAISLQQAQSMGAEEGAAAVLGEARQVSVNQVGCCPGCWWVGTTRCSLDGECSWYNMHTGSRWAGGKGRLGLGLSVRGPFVSSERREQMTGGVAKSNYCFCAATHCLAERASSSSSPMLQALLRAVQQQDSAVGRALLAQVENLSNLRKKEERVAVHAQQVSCNITLAMY